LLPAVEHLGKGEAIMSKIADIQEILGVEPDDVWGPQSQAALDALVRPGGILHVGKASSFADPKDVEAFKKWFAKYKKDGLSDHDAEKKAFAKGDNGIGCWGDDCTGATPACALPPEKMIDRWGSVDAAKHKPVLVTVEDKSVICVLKDRMPHERYITNGAMIDLNPGACAAFGLKPPIMVSATWRWAT
jgi:hypothetical protein